MGSPYVRTSYSGGDKSGMGAALRTNMGREGIDIGPAPNFEADWKRFQPRQETPRYQGAEPRAAMPPAGSGQSVQTAQYVPREAPRAARPRDIGRYMMNQTGNWGHFVDAADVPVGSGIQPGFYGGVTNWDTSNPMIQGHPAYGKSGIAAGGGGNYGISSMGPAPPGLAPSSNSGADYLSPAEQMRWRGVLQNAYGPGPSGG